MTAPTSAELKAARSAEKVVERAEADAKPLAREILQKFMLVFASVASAYQPGTRAEPNPASDAAKFERYSRLAVDCAKALIGYETPRPTAPSPAAIEFSAAVTAKVEVAHKVDLTAMTTDELVRDYRARIAGGPFAANANLSRPAREPAKLPAPEGEAALPEAVTSAPVEAKPADVVEHEPQPLEPVAADPVPSIPAESSVVVPLRLPAGPFSSEPVKPTVAQYADAISSSIGADGRPVASEAARRRISEQALARTAMPIRRGGGGSDGDDGSREFA